MKLIEAVAHTDVGQVRDHNEDAFLVMRELGIVAVADGMGGLEQGEVASSTAVDTVRAAEEALRPLLDAADQEPSARARIQVGQALEVLTQIASQRIQEVTGGQQSGTTLLIAAVVREHVLIAHTGDSRAYMYRSGNLMPLSDDHTVAAAQFRAGIISEEEHDLSPYQHMLYQAVGTQGEVDPDLLDVPSAAGDVLLLCSDGLTGPVSDKAIQEILGQHSDLDDAAEALIQAATDGGAPDNITVVLARLGEGLAPALQDARQSALASSRGFQRLSRTERYLLQLYLDLAVPAPSFDTRRGPHILLEGSAERRGEALEPGAAFGIVPFADGRPRRTPVTASDHAVALVLDDDSMQALTSRRPTLAVHLLRGWLAELAARLAD